MSTESRSRKFTSAHIAALKPNTSICDISDPAVPGLVLRVAVSGSKAWLFRFKWDGTPTRITLGKFPAVGLAEARQLALKNREWLDRGIDPRRAVDRLGNRKSDAQAVTPAKSGPLEPRQEPPAPSNFEQRLAVTPKDRIPRPDPDDRSSVLFIAYEYIEKWFKAQGKNSKEACRMLRADVLPKWHWRDGRTVTSREVIELLDQVVERGAPVMANNLAQMLGHMFKFAIHRGTLENSPVQLLYRPGGKPRRRKRVFSEEELRSFVTNIGSICRGSKRKHVLMVLLLTVQRRGELARAEWTEFDFENRTWTIPAAHSKNKREHAVPLTRLAIAELDALRLLSDGSRFVLPGKNPDRHADPKLITRSVKRLLPRFLAAGIDAFVPHDLRRTGRTTLGRLKVLPFIGERVINHSKGVLEETYDLWDYFDEKRDALERLEKYLLGLRASAPASTKATQCGMEGLRPNANRKGRRHMRGSCQTESGADGPD